MKNNIYYCIILTALLCLAVCPAFPASTGDKVEIGGIAYNVLEGNALEVTYRGSSMSANPYTGDVEIPATLDVDGVAMTVTAIGRNAFNGCMSLTGVSLPSTITTISNNAFYKCTALQSITIPESVSAIGKFAFSQCMSLATVTNLSATPQTIDEGTFSFYGTLRVYDAYKEVYSQAEIWKQFDVVSIESTGDVPPLAVGDKFEYEGVAYTLTSDTEVEVSYRGEKMSQNPYSGSITIPETVQERDFSYTVTAVGRNAFNGCSTLGSVELPSTIRSILSSAFYKCSSLTSITIPENVETIGTYAFYQCTNLTEVINQRLAPQAISSNVFSTFGTLKVHESCIDAYRAAEVWGSFSDIVAIEQQEQEPSDEIINLERDDRFEVDGVRYRLTEYYSNRGIYIESSNNPEGYSGTVTVPSTVHYGGKNYRVEGISWGAFSGNSQLTGIELPGTIITIEGYAFENCTGLSEITIPESVTTIMTSAFAGCTNLRDITKLGNLMNIESDAFTQHDATLHVSPEYFMAFCWTSPWCDFHVTVMEKPQLDLAYTLYFGSDKEYVVEHASYSRSFDRPVYVGSNVGWETIALPYKVTSIVTEDGRKLAPFGSELVNSGEAIPFWLAELTPDGFALTSTMEACVPYLICMPNTTSYGEEYRVSGNVYFYGDNTLLHNTMNDASIYTDSYAFTPAFYSVYSDDAYVLNSSSVIIKGTLYRAGSLFQAGGGTVNSFNAYLRPMTQQAREREFIPISMDENVFADGILDIERFNSMDAASPRRTFTLTGQGVNPSQAHGVVIVNGRKVLF